MQQIVLGLCFAAFVLPSACDDASQLGKTRSFRGASTAKWGSCGEFTCAETYVSWRPCQCNSLCKDYENCCSDYQAVCVSPPTPAIQDPVPSPPPASPTPALPDTSEQPVPVAGTAFSRRRVMLSRRLSYQPRCCLSVKLEAFR